MRNILVLQRHSPFNTSHGREALDMVLALAAVEHSVSVLFCDDAVYQLLDTKQPANLGVKAYPRSFKLFNLYDIDQIYVCQQALTKRGISQQQLSIAATPLDAPAMTTLLAKQHQVITS